MCGGGTLGFIKPGKNTQDCIRFKIKPDINEMHTLKIYKIMIYD